jgi:RNA polymerase sigma-70 factor (ECF subfamily)
VLVSDQLRPEQVVSKKQERDLVRKALDMLPPDYRAAVVLRYWYGMSYQDIAATTQSTESAIKSRLHRARRMMARLLQSQQSPEPQKLELQPQRLLGV